MISFKQRMADLSKNQKAVAGLVKLVAFLVVVGVVLYCDIQFIQVMWRTFPAGAAKVFSLIGAVATGSSVIALIGAEAYWFSRGPQMLWGWIFTAVEVAISAMNVILSFELTGGSLDQIMSVWLWFCPATPVVSALFWVLIFNLDQSQKARHDHREMQDDIDEADRAHARAVHASQMQLKARYLESTTSYLDQIANDPRIQASLEAGAWRFATEELRNLTGLILPTQMPSQALQPPTVTGSLASPTPTSEKKPDPDPTTPAVAPVPADTQPSLDMSALLKIFSAFQAKQPETPAAVQPSYTDDLADSVVPRVPDTENLAPFVVAPSSPNGAKMNGK